MRLKTIRWQKLRHKGNVHFMRRLPLVLSLLLITGFSSKIIAQSTEAELTLTPESSSIDEKELTYEELKAKQKREKNFEDARRCLGVIAVPGDISLSREQIQALPLDLEADDIDLPDANTVELKGQAYAQQGPQKISADNIRYSKTDDRLNASGGVEVFSPGGDRFSAEDLDMEMETFTGSANNLDYVVADRTYVPKVKNNAFAIARGQASAANFLGHDLMELNDVTYTNCVEGNDDVVIKANNLVLDHSTGIGTARNATLKFLGVPVFYTPYISFPISKERKTGFLAPSFGSDSEEGFFIGVPYYINISPGFDATITPYYYSDRGLQLTGEFRYLTENAEGELDVEYLPGDDLQTEEDDEVDRTAVTFYHEHEITEDLEGEIDFQWASDEDYYDDFSNNLFLNSATHLIRRGRLNYYGDIFRAELGVLDYFTLDEEIEEASRPYAQLPYFLVDAKERNGMFGLTYELDASLTQFDRDATVEGTRYFLNPSISLPLEEIYGYVTPKVGFNYAGYSLDNVEAGEEDSPYRYVTTASVDSGLFFEREFNWVGRPHVQTLEPRLFYVYIPEEDQSAIPSFDTSELSLNNFSNIFRENRFIGDDRIGDTNQVTLGVTSRFLDGDTGAERGYFSVGQIYYLSDREISLSSDDANIDRSTSDFLTEASIDLYSDWTLYGFASWDTEESENNNRRIRINYGDDEVGENYFNLGYFYNRVRSTDGTATDSESIDLEAGWRITPSWSVYAQDIYSISDSENRYFSAGVRYDACCWKLTVGGERRFDKERDERDGLFVTLEFTGLTSITSQQGIK